MRCRRTEAGLVLALAGATAGCSGSAGLIDEVPPADRGAPVVSSGPGVDGGTVDLADYRGRVTVVNVWWSGCGPCVKEMPLLVDATEQLGADVALVGINIRDVSVENAAGFERRLGLDFPSIYSPGGENLADFSGALNPRNIPSTLVLDREGRIAARIAGEVPTQTTLVDIVERVLDDPTTAPGSTSASTGAA